MKTTRLLATLAGGAALLVGVAACGDDDDTVSAPVTGEGETTETTEAEAEEMSVEIVSPADGDTVTSPVTVAMEATGIEIEPAGEVSDGAGHFHLMVDVGCVTPGEVIPGDTEGYNHFGKGQTETELELEPGEHTICLQVGDGVHTALDVTHEITITVE